ncbi:adenylyl-sulfate kinase [Cohnella fermenti]|nr:adenylyl-sulfate kinase [Cohnella fermenti]
MTRTFYSGGIFLQEAFTLLLTGLSGAGKTTIAEGIARRLRSHQIQFELLDGDVIRHEIGQMFGYSREERIKVSHILKLLAKTLNRNGISVIIAALTPYQEMRDNYRRELNNYIEAFIDCPLEVCIARDVKGLYKNYYEGRVNNVVGIDDVFEIPQTPDLVLRTSERLLDDCIDQVMDVIYQNKLRK